MANSVVVFFLARRLHFGRTSALIAAILFTIHGTRPEAVTWIAGRFDLIATFFVLTGLYLFVTHHQTGQVVCMWGALIAMGLAILTKESAYSFPLLAAAVLAVLPGASFRQLRRTLPYWALATLLFALRWWVLGGIGGYLDRQSGKPEILQLGVLSAVKALALRIWSAVYFPINWSEEPSRLLALLMAATVAIVVWLLWNVSLNGRHLWFSVAYSD